jgi:hypothetical protein
MDPIDREVAWMAVGQSIVDANNIQRVLFHYNQTGQQGKLADYLADQQLILPHDAFQLSEAAKDNAEKRRKRLESVIQEYQKIGDERDKPAQEYTDELDPDMAAKKNVAADKSNGAVKLNMMETKRLDNLTLPKKQLPPKEKKKSRAIKPASEIIIENEVAKPPAAPAPVSGDGDTVRIMADATPALSPVVGDSLAMPLADEPHPHKLHYLVAGFVAGALLFSLVKFILDLIWT